MEYGIYEATYRVQQLSENQPLPKPCNTSCLKKKNSYELSSRVIALRVDVAQWTSGRRKELITCKAVFARGRNYV